MTCTTLWQAHCLANVDEEVNSYVTNSHVHICTIGSFSGLNLFLLTSIITLTMFLFVPSENCLTLLYCVNTRRFRSIRHHNKLVTTKLATTQIQSATGGDLTPTLCEAYRVKLTSCVASQLWNVKRNKICWYHEVCEQRNQGDIRRVIFADVNEIYETSNRD